MSDTLNTPWIADYLINIAETHGSNITNVPVHIKPGRKVQLLKFLTFQNYKEDDCVWAYVSDKHQQLPVRFSRHALMGYSKSYQKDSQGKRFTQQRSAIATINSFKPVFQRVPTGSVGKMTTQETLALYVDDVKVVGGAGEPEFGSPRTLDTHPDLEEWMKGLRAGDGSGNFLKLRKKRKLAEERGESSLTATLEKSDDGRVIRTEVGTVQSDSNPRAAEQYDWRQSIATKPLWFFKRPPASGTSALKSVATGTNQGSGNSEPSMKPKTGLGRGPLDLDSSPVISRDIENGSPERLQRQTTPSEWLASPERYHTPSSSPEPAKELSFSPPSTPPLFTPEQPQEAQGPEARVTELNEASQGVTTSAREALPNDAEVTPLPPTPGQRRRSLPPFSSASVYSSSLSTTNSRTKATSLPANVFESSASNTRRVPLPSVQFNKEAYGEILVPSSDSGELVIQSSSHENPSPPGPPRATVAAVPKHDMVSSPRFDSSPERVNITYDASSPILRPERSQDGNGARLDELSRMALNGSYPEQLHGDGVQNGDKEDAAKSPSPVPDPESSILPPSSIPIHSQSSTWHRSTTIVEETLAVEGTPYRATPHVTTKRARPSPSPPQDPLLESKRPKLMSRESVTPNRQRHDDGATPLGLFDAELLEVGIEVDLADFDDNYPPPFPWGEGLANLNLRQPEHPLLITNSKLAEIWKSVCRSRGWCE